MFIYKQYNQKSLDAQYNNRLQVPDYADYLDRWKMLSRRTEQALRFITDIPYGNLQREKLDIYPSLQPASKTLIFIHGGYWQMLDKSMFQFIANGFHAYGVTIVLLNYPLAPEVSINQIVLSCRTAISWLYSNVSMFNGDPHQMFLTGHSAGGHLAAMLMTTVWELFNPGLLANPLKGVCAVSGLFNLIPIHLSYINEVIQMNMETAIANSPVTLEPSNGCALIIAVGEAETAEFNDQSRELYTQWKNKVTDHQFLQMSGQNHYSVAEAIADPPSSLHQALRQLMNIV